MSTLVRSPQITVFFQDRCLSHRFIRSTDASMIVERPQRIRAVKVGVATAIARLEQEKAKNSSEGTPGACELLSNALERLNLGEEPSGMQDMVEVIMSTASVDILNHPAVKYVHGDIDGDMYLEKLVTLVRESQEKVAGGESEIPDCLSQGDLYLCGQSLDAIQGAIGAVCEAVDTVFQATTAEPSSSRTGEIKASLEKGCSRAFVAIRPPGHHCGENTPSGFCFVNNVAIGTAHAHLQHGVSRVVILDIDLHHGNGTQAIAWQINEEAYRQTLESETTEVPASSPPLRVFYGSIHDPLSYPCEDGTTAIVQAASVSIHGPHGQHIENVHLLPYDSDEEFWDRLYCGPYASLLQKADAFLKNNAESGEAIVFISAGFDASEHEYSSMSRHGRKVPTTFFKRFAHDARKLADQYAKGRIVSVLEGGYSDRALCSGALAHVLGLIEHENEVDESWWSVENLIKIEKATKKRRGGRSSATMPTTTDTWVDRALSLLSTFDPHPSPPPTPKPIPPSSMTLRDRIKKTSTQSPTPSESGTPPPKSKPKVTPDRDGSGSTAGMPARDELDAPGNHKIVEGNVSEEVYTKKLPRVLLRVNPPTGSG